MAWNPAQDNCPPHNEVLRISMDTGRQERMEVESRNDVLQQSTVAFYVADTVKIENYEFVLLLQ